MKLSNLPKLNKNRLDALHHSGIERIIDLLYFFPHRYVDRTTVLPIRSVKNNGKKVNVVGHVKSIRHAGYGNHKRLEVIISDESGTMKGVWFNGVSYMKKYFKKGDQVVFFGKAKNYKDMPSMAHPDVEKVEDPQDLEGLTRIAPIYPGNKYFSNTYITNKLIQRWIKTALEHVRIPEFLPESLKELHSFPGREKALQMIHFPKSDQEHQQALQRFKYAELLMLQLSMAQLKHKVQEQHEGIIFSDLDNLTAGFFNHYLPFELTTAQKEALNDIKKDVRSGRQMNRLLQGDVGSGKTIIAMGAILMALDNDCQAAFMAPTEILAEQHYHTLQQQFQSFQINIRLLSGGQNAAEKEKTLNELEAGDCHIVVGTHAIIQENVQFNNLGLVVIDEQHRFGVQQRADVLQKGNHPHLLVMSATPIPRSLAMTLYSDLDISMMKELPGGRKPIKTAIRTSNDSRAVYRFIEDTLEDGGQAYIVYPLVEESEKVDLRDATAGYDDLKERFSNFDVGLLHGQMKPGEKEEVMQQFVANDIQILVSTTVIEVGVDVPNATIMMIRHANRFGLSQLHQLRGRIGRGEKQSYCILIHDQRIGKEAKFRLKKMAKTNDGFAIAEADLQLRGPGDFLGTKQSGLPELTVADIVEDQEWVLQAKEDAAKLTRDDPEMKKTENQALRKVFTPYFERRKKYYGLG